MALMASPWAWGGITVLVTYLDYLSGPYIQLPIGYAIPVLLVAWNRGTAMALALAIVLPTLRPLMFSHGDPGYTPAILLVNALIRMIFLATLAILASRLAALSEHIHRLENILPICAWCRRIRVGEGMWVPMEAYLICKNRAAVTHGICPECRSEVGWANVAPRSP
jgi:hypothetical protein